MTPARGGDVGESLIEILLSIMILGIAVTALLLGMTTAASTSGLNARQTQQAETLRNYVAALQALPYQPCAGPGAYSPAGVVPTGFSGSAVVNGYSTGTTFSGSCTVDQGAQRIVVTITANADTRVRPETATVVKRKPCLALPC